jgi:predicted membrane-bound spermidine synthase
MPRRSPLLFYAIFTVSGFSGLIYESIWTHYLKLFLGHAAYAQTLVLSIFMGGMALGSWICSRQSHRWRNLLVAYALAEGVIGLFALLFHTLFAGAIQLAYGWLLPGLGSAPAAHALKWALSALLILPPSVLLGMTFPLMSAGVMRWWPQHPGRTISLLYFTNSVGAAVGVLVSGFALVRLVGLPWTVRIAGLLNLALALAVWSLARRGPAVSKPTAKAHAAASAAPPAAAGPDLPFLLAALATGAASFIYEIGWIRMLSLVLGTSTHAFELMLSAFILGLAFGGLWIQRVIDRIRAPERYFAFVQVLMGLFALCTLPLYGQTFSVMQWLLRSLDRTDGGYLLFNLSGNALALAVMLPATVCAGMTLPLLTYGLLRRGRGEQSIGAVYAANTLGAIVGVLFAVHVGMTGLGLKGLIAFGAGCDILVGLAFLWLAAGYASKLVPAGVTGASAVALAAVVLLVEFDPYRMASGVYRTGMLLYPQLTEVAFQQDGKTATISAYVERGSGVVTIATNGKPDASVGMRPDSQPTTDEATATLLAVLPMAFHPGAEKAANIGLGSGLTTATLLGNPRLRRVDTIEIERSVIDAARHFRPRVERVYADPRSHLHVDDAKTFFSVQQEQYDVVISEPSNPWVSGVAGLFSDEFYRQVKQHLRPDGVFAQWVQLYEIDTDLVLSIIRALSDNFSDFVVYATNDQDMLIVARPQGTLPPLDGGLFVSPELATALARIDVGGLQDVEIRRIGTKRLFARLLASSGIPPNSDYDPIVDQNAARTRFLQANAFEIQALSLAPVPAFEMLTGARPPWTRTDVLSSPLFAKSQFVRSAAQLRDYSVAGRFDPALAPVSADVRQMAAQFGRAYHACLEPDPMARQAALYNVLANMTAFLRPEELEPVWPRLEAGPCAGSLSPMERSWIALFKAVSRRDGAAMERGAQSVLASRMQLPPQVAQFVVAAGMLGGVTSGDRAGAQRLWMTFRPVLFRDGRPGLLFRLLEAESAAPN